MDVENLMNLAPRSKIAAQNIVNELREEHENVKTRTARKPEHARWTVTVVQIIAMTIRFVEVK